MTRFWHGLRLVIVVGVRLVTAYNGIVEGINATHSAGTVGMKVATVTQLLYGVSAASSLIAIMLRRRWVSWLLAVWGIALVGTGVLAPSVYAGRSIAVGAVLGGAATAVVVFVFWAWGHTSNSATGEQVA